MAMARICSTLKTLRKVEVAVKKYIKKSHSLANAAKEAGFAIGIHNSELDVLIAAFDAKIKLLETTVRERRRLEYLRLIWDHNLQKLAQVA